MKVVCFSELIRTNEMQPDSLVVVIHYVSERIALRVVDLFYTGNPDKTVLLETIYAVQFLGVTPGVVCCPSADAYLEATAELRHTLEFRTYDICRQPFNFSSRTSNYDDLEITRILSGR